MLTFWYYWPLHLTDSFTLNNQLFIQGAHGFTLRDSEKLSRYGFIYIYISHICIHIFFFLCVHSMSTVYTFAFITHVTKRLGRNKNIHREGQSSPYWNVKILEIERTFFKQFVLSLCKVVILLHCYGLFESGQRSLH